MSSVLLQLAQVSRHFGGVKAVDELDLQVVKGEIVGLIGPNGSGKSTTVNLVTGLIPLSSGDVYFNGTSVSRMPTHERLAHGISRTFQNIRLFGHLSVWQNVWVAQNSLTDRRREGVWARWLGGRRTNGKDILGLLELCDLLHRKDAPAASLAFGEQRRLEFARALATRPQLLLLDEPAAGMNAAEVQQLRERILVARDSGITIVLIEHVIELVMGLSDRIAVLNFGRKIADATPHQIQQDPSVRKAYLGEE